MSHLVFSPSLFLWGGLNISSSHSAQKNAFWTIFWLFLIYIFPEKLHLYLWLWFFSRKTLLLSSSTTYLITCYMAQNSTNKVFKTTSFPIRALLMKGHRINSITQAWILSIIIIFLFHTFYPKSEPWSYVSSSFRKILKIFLSFHLPHGFSPSHLFPW